MKKMLLLTASLFAFICADEFAEDGTTTIGGYGEMHWDMESTSKNLDFHRFIMYFKHQFDSQWSMMSEVEIEHNMVGSEEALGYGSTNTYNDKYKGGYLAMEQAYLNYYNGTWGFRGGVVLVPAGITNEFHEPPTFMSVERPEYSSKIIPTTWFDNGFSFYGAIGNVNLNFTMTGDMDGDKIGEGIRSARRKGHYSRTDSWTKTLQASWTGMEGLKVGGSITMNDAPATAVTVTSVSECGVGMDEACNNAITRDAVGFNLTELNATYSKNNLYARFETGTITYTDNVHQVMKRSGNDTPLDESDDFNYYEAELREIESSTGHYLDLGYNVADLLGCDGDLFVWARNSSYKKADDGDSHDISLVGLTFKPLNNIAFKFETGTSRDNDVMRMGLGYMF